MHHQNDYRRIIPMRIGTLLGIAVVMAACAESPSPVAPRALDQSPTLAADVSSTQTTLPFNTTLWIACANGGAGEMVALSGELEFSSHEVLDADGGTHERRMVRPSRVAGVGGTTGLNYRGTGMSFLSEGVAAEGSSVYTYVNNFRIIGQGPGNNLLVHAVVHQTTDPDGNVVAEVNASSSTCK
jgi:hypothetical protein